MTVTSARRSAIGWLPLDAVTATGGSALATCATTWECAIDEAIASTTTRVSMEDSAIWPCIPARQARSNNVGAQVAGHLLRRPVSGLGHAPLEAFPSRRRQWRGSSGYGPYRCGGS